MGLFRKSKDEFEPLFRAAIASLGGRVIQYWAEGASVELRGAPLTLQFRNVKNEILALPPSDRAPVLTRWASDFGAAGPDLDQMSLAEAKPLLYPRFGLPVSPTVNVRGVEVPVAETPIERTVLEGHLALQIGASLPSLFSYLMPKHLAAWDATWEDVFTIALENLRAVSPPQVFLPAPDFPGMFVGIGGDHLDAARALLVEETLRPAPAFGFYLSVPTRDNLLVRRIDDPQDFEHFEMFKQIAEGFYRDGAYKISPEVYWHGGARFVHIGLVATPEGPRVYYPPAVTEYVLNRDRLQKVGQP